jgi:hypothetical protein
MDLLVIHDEAVERRDDAKISCPGQPGTFHRDDSIIVARQQRVVAAAVAFAAREDAKLKMGRGQVGRDGFPAAFGKLLRRRTGNELNDGPAHQFVGKLGLPVRRDEHHHSPELLVTGQRSLPVHELAKPMSHHEIA